MQCSIFRLKRFSQENISGKILNNRAYETARNPKYHRQQRELTSMVDTFFDKKTGMKASVNEELPQELHKKLKND